MSSVFFIKSKKLSGVTSLDNAFIRSFLPELPELALKAYIYGLMLLSGGAQEDTDMSAELGCSEDELRLAFAHLERLGLVNVIGETPLQIEYKDVDEAASRAYIGTASGARYAELIKKLGAVLGTRQLSGAELTKIYDWVDLFGFEQDAAVRIVSYCLDKKGTRVSVAYMDSMAKRLAAEGALTRELVDEAIEYERLTSSGAGRILKRWHQSRPPTADELALYEKWTRGWGYDEDAIDYACTKLTSAASPSFSYIDSIIEDWRRKGKAGPDVAKEMRMIDDGVREVTRQAFARAGIKSAPNSEQRLKIQEWTVDYAMSPELIYLAAELSKDGTRQYACMRRLVDEWHDKGISSISAAKAYYEAYQKNSSAPSARGKKNRALNYEQGGTYTKEELRKLGISLGEEFYSDD